VEQFARILKLLGHPDRLRILALLRRGELTVSELVSVMELSQPRVTQYVRSLEDAGIVERLREGSWVFSRLRSDDDALSSLVRGVLKQLPSADPILAADRNRLEDVRASRATRAERFFADVANNRGQLSHEFLPKSRVEAIILDQLGERNFEFMVDLGTGSGRILALLSDRVRRGTGVDLSPDMLRVARYTLRDERFGHLFVQQSDLCQTPLADGVADLVTVHQVLHHLDQPLDALSEAMRLLRPEGVLLVVDFAEHEREEFRDQYAHRRLGFSEREIADQIGASGFHNVLCTRVDASDADHPDLLVWRATRTTTRTPELVS